MSDLPDSADVIVVGTGAAGMCAAIRLHTLGLAPILIEKTGFFGGSTAVSGGAVWIPGNPHSEEVGRPDTREAARTYLEGEIGNRMNGPLVDAFLDTGPEVVRFLEAETAVKFAARALGPTAGERSETPGHASVRGRVSTSRSTPGSSTGTGVNPCRRTRLRAPSSPSAVPAPT